MDVLGGNGADNSIPKSKIEQIHLDLDAEHEYRKSYWDCEPHLPVN